MVVSLEVLTPGSDLLGCYFLYFLRECYLTVGGWGLAHWINRVCSPLYTWTERLGLFIQNRGRCQSLYSMHIAWWSRHIEGIFPESCHPACCILGFVPFFYGSGQCMIHNRSHFMWTNWTSIYCTRCRWNKPAAALRYSSSFGHRTGQDASLRSQIWGMMTSNRELPDKLPVCFPQLCKVINTAISTIWQIRQLSLKGSVVCKRTRGGWGWSSGLPDHVWFGSVRATSVQQAYDLSAVHAPFCCSHGNSQAVGCMLSVALFFGWYLQDMGHLGRTRWGRMIYFGTCCRVLTDPAALLPSAAL